MGDAWINMGDAMMSGRGRCRKSGAENNRSGKRNFYLAEHFRVFRLSFATRPENGYRFFICTVAYPEFGEEVIARMLEFGKPLSDRDFNYLRVADGATWPNAKRFLSVPTVGS